MSNYWSISSIRHCFPRSILQLLNRMPLLPSEYEETLKLFLFELSILETRVYQSRLLFGFISAYYCGSIYWCRTQPERWSERTTIVNGRCRYAVIIEAVSTVCYDCSIGVIIARISNWFLRKGDSVSEERSSQTQRWSVLNVFIGIHFIINYRRLYFTV